MELTNFGAKLFRSPKPFIYNDFELTRYDEKRYQFCYHLPRPDMVVAIHEGTSVEAARLFKLLLITRRLAQ